MIYSLKKNESISQRVTETIDKMGGTIERNCPRDSWKKLNRAGKFELMVAVGDEWFAFFRISQFFFCAGSISTRIANKKKLVPD